MVHVLIHNGQVEVQGPIPDTWEGQVVKIMPPTPDDPLPDLERRLAELHALGRVELDPDEQERVAAELRELDRVSIDVMSRLTGSAS